MITENQLTGGAQQKISFKISLNLLENTYFRVSLSYTGYRSKTLLKKRLQRICFLLAAVFEVVLVHFKNFAN